MTCSQPISTENTNVNVSSGVQYATWTPTPRSCSAAAAQIGSKRGAVMLCVSTMPGAITPTAPRPFARPISSAAVAGSWKSTTATHSSVSPAEWHRSAIQLLYERQSAASKRVSRDQRAHQEQGRVDHRDVDALGAMQSQALRRVADLENVERLLLGDDAVAP